MPDHTHPGDMHRPMTTPRAAAIAGILFALLFAVSLVLVRLAIPADLSSDASWVESGTRQVTLAASLMPLAGIAFLWFVGVIRDRIGELEDRFVSTVFLGSSLLFLAMVFTSMAIAGGLVTSSTNYSEKPLAEDVIVFGRAVMLQISNVYALRMAGVCMISLATIWLRTRLMPPWLAGSTYLLALLLLLVINLSLWVTLIFPAWVFFISVLILIMNFRQTRAAVAR